MAASGDQDLFEMDSLRIEIEKKAMKGRGMRRAWVLFIVVGVPAALLAALAPLTMAHIYLEPLRPLWQPWPPDVLKPFIGIAVFAATLAYLAFRSGRLAGLRSGTVAALAALRNVLDRRVRAPPAPPDVVEVPGATPQQPPTPPPPPPADEPKIEIRP